MVELTEMSRATEFIAPYSEGAPPPEPPRDVVTDRIALARIIAAPVRTMAALRSGTGKTPIPQPNAHYRQAAVLDGPSSSSYNPPSTQHPLPRTRRVIFQP